MDTKLSGIVTAAGPRIIRATFGLVHISVGDVLYVLGGHASLNHLQGKIFRPPPSAPTFTGYSPDYIVCCDGNFTQKRRKGQGSGHDGPRAHPDTVFLSPARVRAMEERMDQLKSRPGRTRNRREQVVVNDTCEEGLSVPNSVLDNCQESFAAADKKREKASTQFFADTGLMALLCRHDRVLFLINMTTAGERQYYVFALLQELFNNIPSTATVGVLYDIGCSTHRSCVKYGFLEDLLLRIVFALSVFHTYGHQWVCQLIFHPRKCKGFGLSDGEGCERFWSQLKKLIPSLRVSGMRCHLIDQFVI